MNSMPIALILTQVAAQEARSALPSAPVVPSVDKVPMALRTRKSVAGGLRHLADVVAPPRPIRRAQAPSGECRQAG
jgi:hypothetical protein